MVTPSNGEGATGWWPDALIPEVDSLAHETRNAFPFSVGHYHPEVVYGDVCPESAQRPGEYREQVMLEASGLTPLSIPVHIRVSPVEVPATSSLPTSFGFSGLTACRAQGCTADADATMQLTQRYARLALTYRISLHGMTMEPAAARVGAGA